MYKIGLILVITCFFHQLPLFAGSCDEFAEFAQDYVTSNRANIEKALEGKSMSYDDFYRMTQDGTIVMDEGTRRFHWGVANAKTQGNTIFRERFDDMLVMMEKSIPEATEQAQRNIDVVQMMKQSLNKLDESGSATHIIEASKKSGAFDSFTYRLDQTDRIGILDDIAKDMGTDFAGQNVRQMEIQIGRGSDQVYVVFKDASGKVITAPARTGYDGVGNSLSASRLSEIFKARRNP